MSVHFISTLVTVQACRRCGAAILFGLAEGIPARVDLQPVNPVGELEAIRAGRSTYHLRFGQLEYRLTESILARRDIAPLLITHVCNKSAPAAHWDTRAGSAVMTVTPIEGIPF